MQLLTRADWGATLALGPAMALPARGLHVHHSVTLADDDRNPLATGDVAADMREIERIGRQRFGRFPYSYCIHPSGWVGEGAGTNIGAHTADYNSTSFGVCFIGNYENQRATPAAKLAFRELRARLVQRGHLRANHYVEPHQARKATACPGDNIIRDWDELLTPYDINTPEDDFMALFDTIEEFEAAVEKAAEKAVANQFSIVGRKTRSALVDLLADTIAAPTHPLGQAVRVAVADVVRSGPVPVDTAADVEHPDEAPDTE